MFRKMGMISSDSNFRKLDENHSFLMGHLFEMIYLINKKRKKQICLGGLYGDPACGIVSSNSKWCMVGGSEIIIWKEGGAINFISDKPLNWVQDSRQAGPFEVELLIDPWSDQAAIWYLNIDTLERCKIRPLEPYTCERYDNVEW